MNSFMTELEDIIDKIVKSYESELREYRYWSIYLIQLEDRLKLLNTKMYDISAVRYGESMGKKSTSNREHMLTRFIMEKNELEREIYIIKDKVEHVNELLDQLNDEDRAFIESALINRMPRETNDMIATGMGITESGLRYKVKAILKSCIKERLEITKED